jgi:glyoxylase-like metal-dependent hydrolase (beta-lactamase superfamily II)
METLWGEFLPVPSDRLSVPQNGGLVEVGGLTVRAIDTPGHADHHYVYILEDLCFSGDIGGVRLMASQHLRLPMPPPDFHPGKWRLSLRRLNERPIQRIAPTHFGIYEDVQWHLKALEQALGEVESWIEATMPSDPPLQDLNTRFIEWSRRRSLDAGVKPDVIEYYEAANPSWMSSTGIQRYWRKFRSDHRDSA